MKAVKFLLEVECIVILTTLTLAQQDEDKRKTATIYGQVLDPDNKPIEGLLVSLRFADYTYVAETHTDKQGRYKFGKVEISQNKKYLIAISNPKDPDDPTKEKQILTPDKYALQGDGSYLFQDIVFGDEEYKKEINFKLTKSAIIAGKVTFDDGTEARKLQMAITNTFGTSAETNENGNYIIKGVKPDENGKVSIIMGWEEMDLYRNWRRVVINAKDHGDISGCYSGFILHDIPVKEGETITKDIIIPRIDASQVSIKYRILVNGELCTLEKVIQAIDNKIETDMVVALVKEPIIKIKSAQIEYFYRYNPVIVRKMEIWDIPPGKYMLEVGFSFNDDLEVSPAQTEIEIKENKTLEIDIYLTVKDKKLEKIEIKLKE